MTLAIRVVIISIMMIATSVSLTGVGYAGSEGVAIIAIHCVWAYLLDKAIKQRNSFSKGLVKAAAVMESSNRKIDELQSRNLQLQTTCNLARNKIDDLEAEINERAQAKRKFDEWETKNLRPHWRRQNGRIAAKIHGALSTLGLNPADDIGYVEIVSAYRKKVKEVHPDNGGDGKNIDKLKAARDYLEERVRGKAYL